MLVGFITEKFLAIA